MTTYKFEGSKYHATKNLPDREITKLIRADLKKAGIKASVRKRSSTWSWAIDVEIKQAPAAGIYRPEYLSGNYDHAGWATPEASALIKRVEAIVNAYNFDNSDLMTDYFHCRFYESVKFSDELCAADRARIMAKASSAA